MVGRAILSACWPAADIHIVNVRIAEIAIRRGVVSRGGMVCFIVATLDGRWSWFSTGCSSYISLSFLDSFETLELILVPLVDVLSSLISPEAVANRDSHRVIGEGFGGRDTCPEEAASRSAFGAIDSIESGC